MIKIEVVLECKKLGKVFVNFYLEMYEMYK